MPVKMGIPDTDYISGIREAVRSSWQFSWTLVESNKMKEITDCINPWLYRTCSRRNEVVLCRLRIGHTHFSHGFLMSNDHQPFCDDCLVPLTVRHLLVECPSLQELRERHFNKNRDGIFNMKHILGRDVNEDSLFNYIKEAGYFNQI